MVGNHLIEWFVVMRRSSRGFLAALIGVVTPGVVVIPLTLAMAGPAPIQTVSFHLSGHAEHWTVPAGVSALRVVADGARGGQGGPRGLGGHGAEESAIVSVTPGDTIQVMVGGSGGQVRTGGFPDGGNGGHQGGPAGNDGGGGGGASSVEIVRINPLDPPSWHVVAGGGGGGGGSQAGVDGDRGRGGDSGNPGWGGVGGSASLAGCFWIPRPSLRGGGGGGANNLGGPGSSGVDCGAGDPTVGGYGLLTIGGTGADAACCVGGGGGGGGGGLVGGGGGGAPDTAGGGGDGGSGGGSGAVGPGVVHGTESTRDGVNDSDGFVVIAYIVGEPTSMSLTSSPASPVAGQPVSVSATVHPVPDGGTVQFSVDGVNVGAPVPVDLSTGTATLPPTSSLGVGSHTVSASYSGTADFAASTSFAPSQQSGTVQVLPDTDPPAVSVTAPAPPPGQNGYFNLHDLAVAGGVIAVTVSASDTAGMVTSIGCTDNGAAVAVAGQSGSNPRTGTVSLSTTGTHAVSCTATDSAGNSGNNGGPGTATVNIDATAPVLTVPVHPVTVNATGPGGTPVSSYSVSTVDSDPGDNPSISCTPSTPHQFAIGDTSVTCQATDRAGNTSPGQQFVVHVAGAAEQLDNLAAAVRGVGPGHSLSAKVAVARLALSHGDTCGASIALTAFIIEVTVLAGRTIPADQAAQLIADARRIKAVIGC